MSTPPEDPSSAQPDPALSFGGVAAAYERGRPGYPRAAAVWLTGEEPLSVLELGAGTGKLTEQLVALGHDVHATDPDPAMLDQLALKLPEARVSQTTAEEIPAADATYDVVVAGQAYHWFDHERALPEIARVLKRGGRLALTWNIRDARVPWVKRLGAIIGDQESLATDPPDSLLTSPNFGPIEQKTFKHWHAIDRESIQDMVLSRSNVATLDAPGREAKLQEVLAFYDDYGRGMDGMQIPVLAQCFHAVLGIRPQPRARPAGEQVDQPGDQQDGQDSAASSGVPAEPVRAEQRDDTAERSPVEPPTDDDSGVLLIDFR